MLCLIKSCLRCGGDLVMDEEDWRCVQCAHYYYGGRPNNGTHYPSSERPAAPSAVFSPGNDGGSLEPEPQREGHSGRHRPPSRLRKKGKAYRRGGWSVK